MIGLDDIRVLKPESAIAGHDGTLMVQNSRDRIFFGPGEAGFEKNCKVNPRTFAFLKDLGGGGVPINSMLCFHTFTWLISLFIFILECFTKLSVLGFKVD